ncbi:acylphosphatase [Oceanobacillus sp. CFH 90083]|uniref:acylphosphatase n=1 Tax=Oceanobacillus sp. CFH 90083 TaxID=2592336 RepID=UPI00128BBC4D|nr:acylphosphatase [Oceanobacillus sp. CFH 90083]
MSENNAEWLSHLSSEVISDVHGSLLDAYVIALEGWRRGLKLRWHVENSEKFSEMVTWFTDRPGQLFSLSSDSRTHYFFRSRGDKVTNEAVFIGKDKGNTKQHLSEHDIAVPHGKVFTAENEKEEIIEYGKKLGFPVVLKPKDGSFGRGVFVNITSTEELEVCYDYIKELGTADDIIMEQYLKGKDYRLYVVDDEVVGAMHRQPPNVVGDGVHTIEQLIELKNAEREKNPRLVSCPIIVDDELTDFIGKDGHTLSSVPEKEEHILLNFKGNISLGGDPIDVLDSLSQEVKDTAVKALRSIEGLTHGAVDIMINETDNKAYVLELNPTAQLGGLLYPMKGKSRDIPKAIIDFYFPETKGNDVAQINTFFDFHDVLDPLQNRDATVTTVTPCPQQKIYMKKYIVIGDVLDLGYHRGLRKQAFERELHGYIMTKEIGDIEIVVGGTDSEMVEDFKNGIWEDEERATVMEVLEEDVDEAIKVGFEIKTDLKTQVEELKWYKRELEETELALKKAEVRRRKYYKSLSWRVTSPIRGVGSIFKKFKG